MAEARFPLYARVLHWLMAAIIIPAWCLGILGGRLLPHDMHALSFTLLGIHKEIATAIIILIVLRLALRATFRAPPLPSTTPNLHRILARTTQALMYGLMVAVPLSGWAMSNAHGYSAPLLWVATLPRLTLPDHALGLWIMTAHHYTAWALGGLIVLHLAGVVWHVRQKDGVLRQMA